MKRLHQTDLGLRILFFASSILLLLCTLCAFGQDPVPAPAPAGPSSVMVWTLLTPVIVPVVIALIKLALMFWGAKIPKVIIPILAPVLGALIDWLASGTFGAGTAWGAALGSAGVGLREILDQVRNLNKPAA